MAPPRPHPLASALAFAARLISGVQVRWYDCAPNTRQRVYFANHTSHLDAVVLWAALPGAARILAAPVAGRDYWEKTATRRYLSSRVFRAVLINRRPAGTPPTRAAAEAVTHDLVAALDRGLSLIVFPEGTRGSGDEVSAFKSGLYHLARQRPDVELVPAYLENLNRILPKGEVLPVPFMSSATFGPPIHLTAGESKADFLARARDAVCRLKP